MPNPHNEIGQTRSGAFFRAVPIATPPTFQLGELLERALSIETDEQCFDIDDVSGGLWWGALAVGTEGGVVGQDTAVHQVEAGGRHWQGLEEGELEEGVDVLEDGELAESHVLDRSENGELVGSANAASNRVHTSGSSSAQLRKQRHRQKRRNAWFKQHGQSARHKAIEKHVGGSSHIPVEVELPSLPFSQCGYQGINVNKNHTDNNIYTLEELKAQGYRVVSHIHGVSQPIVDSNTNKVFGVVVGTRDDPSYIESTQKAFEFLEARGSTADFGTNSEHRRGNHHSVHYGVSYGQGSQEPHWLKCDHEELMQDILANAHVARLATFASCAFAMWAPNVYGYYFRVLGELFEKLPKLAWLYYRTVWTCITFNFGPIVCCRPHRDFLNLPFGWCAIQALGIFDHTLGGHLVLPDLKLVIEFPPGSLILIPSALLTHANTPVRPWERRISFTQFCSGGLFRFVENGFRTEKQLKKQDKTQYAIRMDAKAGRRDMGIGLWSTLNDLLANGMVTLLSDSSTNM